MFAYTRPPCWTELNLLMSSVHFGRKPNRKRVCGSLNRTSQSHYGSEPNRTKPKLDRSKPRLKKQEGAHFMLYTTGYDDSTDRWACTHILVIARVRGWWILNDIEIEKRISGIAVLSSIAIYETVSLSSLQFWVLTNANGDSLPSGWFFWLTKIVVKRILTVAKVYHVAGTKKVYVV